MNLKIYTKIEVLLYNNVNDRFPQSTERFEFENSSINFSGNFMIITTHDMTSRQNTTCTPFNLDKVKAYKTQ